METLQEKKNHSQDTLYDDNFEYAKPGEIFSPERVDTPTHISTPKSEQSKLLQKLTSFSSPFKSSKGFLLKKSKSVDEYDEKDGKKSKKAKSDAELAIEDAEEDQKAKKKKKGGARSRAGALVRRLSSLGGRKQEVRVEHQDSSSNEVSLAPDSFNPPPSIEVDRLSPTIVVIGNDDWLPASESDDYVEMLSPIESPPQTNSTETPSSSQDSDPPIPEDITSVATNHPVSTKPFAVSAWKPRATKPIEIERPIESPSPEDALRRRISFVAQATICVSEDKEEDFDFDLPEDPDSPITRLSRMVDLARAAERQSLSPSRSRSPSPHLRPFEEDISTPVDERTDDEEFEDTEELSRPTIEADMPPYGDLIAGGERPPTLDMGNSASVSNPSQISDSRKEYLYKILVIGELGTGKTSIIKRYVHQFFSQHYRATIGVDFALKVLNWDSNTTIRLQLWDIAGQERFGNMTRVYYKEAVGAFIVFDVSRVSTFEAVVKWKQDLDSKVQLPDGSQIPCVLLGNKCDQTKEGAVNNQAKMDEFCKEKGFLTWYETSAKENINIEEAARTLVTKILSNEVHGQTSGRDGDRILLEEGRNSQAPKRKCNC